jgi:uncharacterized protein
MQVYALRLPPEGRRFRGDDPSDILEFEDSDDLAAAGPVQYDLHVQVVSGQLLARGSVAAPVAFRCSRCLDRFTATVEEPDFSVLLELPKGALGGGRAAAPREPGDDTPLPGDEPSDRVDCVDLTPEIREAIVLNFPAYPVCRGDCRGLCPRCGVNRNRETCRCAPASDSGWTALDQLKLE